MVWYSHLLKNFPQFIVIHTVKGFGVVSKAAIAVFLELSCFFDGPADVGNLIFGSSAFSKTSLNIWKFMVPYICINILYWCFPCWLTSLCIIGSSFIQLIRTDLNAFFLIMPGFLNPTSKQSNNKSDKVSLSTVCEWFIAEELCTVK